MDKIKLLLVEDDLVDQKAFVRLVKSQKLPYDYRIAGSAAEARKLLASQKFDIVLSDYLLGDGSAFDVFEAVKDTPIVVINGSGNEEVAVNAMKLGAYDYLIKDLERYYLTVLPLTVANTLKRRQVEADMHRFNQNLGRLGEEVQTMMASAQLLQQKLGADLNEQSQECLDRIITGARNMASLIKELGQPIDLMSF